MNSDKSQPLDYPKGDPRLQPWNFNVQTIVQTLIIIAIPALSAVLWQSNTLLTRMDERSSIISVQIDELKSVIGDIKTQLNTLENRVIEVTINERILRRTVENHLDED